MKNADDNDKSDFKKFQNVVRRLHDRKDFSKNEHTDIVILLLSVVSMSSTIILLKSLILNNFAFSSSNLLNFGAQTLTLLALFMNQGISDIATAASSRE